MPDYKEMYLTMVRASEKALRLSEEAAQVIIEAQQKCEELYLAGEDETKASPVYGEVGRSRDPEGLSAGSCFDPLSRLRRQLPLTPKGSL